MSVPMLRFASDGDYECTLADFLENNATDEDTCAEVSALAVGQSVRLGGGACPTVDIERIA